MIFDSVSGPFYGPVQTGVFFGTLALLVLSIIIITIMRNRKKKP